MRLCSVLCSIALAVSVSACERENTGWDVARHLRPLTFEYMWAVHVCDIGERATGGERSGYAVYAELGDGCAPDRRSSATILEGSRDIHGGMVAWLVTFKDERGHDVTYLLSTTAVNAFVLGPLRSNARMTIA